MLKGKNILVGLTGSIAAYKAAILVRLLVKNQCSVKVVMTELAKEFITPLTMATLSKNPVLTDFFSSENGQWNSHVDLGLWADAFVIAPATANTIAKMSGGIADNLMLTTYLSARCPIFVAPAMDLDMLQHPATVNNIEVLRSRGHIIIEPAVGELASGLDGKGRMTEPEEILNTLSNYFQKKKLSHSLAGKKVLITAGPTYETIDPVRFIGNYSSGKMGFSLADEAFERGAEVIVIAGPTAINTSKKPFKVFPVTSAKEMYDASLLNFNSADIVIFSAAVADFTPAEKFTDKLKGKKEFKLKLRPTVDIAKELGAKKSPNQILIGFALETSDEIKNAGEKLKKKNLDFIVLNSLNDKEAGFGFDTNKITIVDKHNKKKSFELKSKALVAKDIFDAIEKLIKK
jgi:phosphopantothenoylcysteine decarboxylase/phosphopantothenate--cysteine ligase